ncbi:hypothetical protein [Actinoplanes sp. DH11]|uniref:hypothetical protein n=1 Tax=Actinoplanes sp. DH11 TaxID=2857011 RepID=UPI001E5E6DE0|nr:hypothetical protein [Actinoplanes sp. DH11]
MTDKAKDVETAAEPAAVPVDAVGEPESIEDAVPAAEATEEAETTAEAEAAVETEIETEAAGEPEPAAEAQPAGEAELIAEEVPGAADDAEAQPVDSPAPVVENDAGDADTDEDEPETDGPAGLEVAEEPEPKAEPTMALSAEPRDDPAAPENRRILVLSVLVGALAVAVVGVFGLIVYDPATMFGLMPTWWAEPGSGRIIAGAGIVAALAVIAAGMHRTFLRRRN